MRCGSAEGDKKQGQRGSDPYRKRGKVWQKTQRKNDQKIGGRIDPGIRIIRLYDGPFRLVESLDIVCRGRFSLESHGRRSEKDQEVRPYGFSHPIREASSGENPETPYG